MRCKGISALLAALTWSAVAAAGPDEQTTTTIVAYLRPASAGLDAESLARALVRGRAEFDSDLSARFDSPISARPLAPGIPVPPHIRYRPDSARARLSRYVVLEYPVVRTVTSIRATLRERGLVGYAGAPTRISWAATPSDPFYGENTASTPLIPEAYRSQRWFFEMMGFPAAWEVTTGHATVGMIDTGIDVTHPEFSSSLRLNQSWAFDGSPQGNPSIAEEQGFAGHGTHTSGLVAAEASLADGLGTAGACWSCGLAMAKIGWNEPGYTAGGMQLLDNGVQAINLSAGYLLDDPGLNCPDPDLFSGDPAAFDALLEQADPLCTVVDLARARDVPFVAVSQNMLGPVAFPASAPGVIAVGGVEQDGTLWNDTGDPAECLEYHCGSGSGPEQDFVAPAKHILSTFPAGAIYNPDARCTDDAQENFLTKGYDYCTGTSMAGPLVTGAIAVLRSAHPLLPVRSLEEALRATASNAGVHDDTYGYGIPNVGDALSQLLGQSGGIALGNRLTPMFVLKDDTWQSHLFSSVPQVVVAALAGTLHGRPLEVQSGAYASASYLGAAPIPGYAFPADFESSYPMQPVVAFWLFTTPKNPFGGAELVPLHRMSLRRGDSCLVRDHAYATDKPGLEYFSQTDACAGPGESKMVNQGIEGYLLPTCPAGFTCLPANREAEGGLQCVYLRRRADSSHQEDWALVLEDQLPGQDGSPYWGHTGTAPGMEGCLGYVFTTMDSDSDRLIDGIEHLLGTNRLAADSDGDCRTDAQEYGAFDVPSSDPAVAEDHPNSTCDLIFAYDAEL